MPTFVYRDRGGKVRELRRRIADRDNVPKGWRRVRVGRVAVLRGADDPGAARNAVPRAFRQLEQTMSASEIARQTGHSVQTIKRAWNF